MNKGFVNDRGFLEDRIDEILSAISHGIGTMLSVAALVLLVVYSSIYGGALEIVSSSVYGASLVMLYLSSTVYHISRKYELKAKLQVFDHASIFILIAGTYTPYTLVALGGAWGWSLFGVVWGLAFLGIGLKVFHTGKFELLSTICYVVMGWIILLAVGPLIDSLSSPVLAWLFIGGGVYTLGSFFFLYEKIPYNHAIWHLFVLGGSISHFFGIYLLIKP